MAITVFVSVSIIIRKPAPCDGDNIWLVMAGSSLEDRPCVSDRMRIAL